jgi:hypothetical protein
MSKIISEFAAKPEHLQLIRKSRPLVNPDIAEKDIKAPTIATTYPVYNVGLKDLKASKVALKTPASRLRMHETDANQNIAASYEVGAVTIDDTLPAVHTDLRYLSKLNNSLHTAERVSQTVKEPGKLRMINIPALHTEAYWLHYDDTNAKDVVIPVQSFLFPENVPVPYNDFIRKMSAAAKEVPDTSNNELGG